MLTANRADGAAGNAGDALVRADGAARNVVEGVMVLRHVRRLLSHVTAGRHYRIPAVFVTVVALLATNGLTYGQAAGNETVIARVDGVAIDTRDYELALEAFRQDLSGLDEKARHDFVVQYLIDVAVMAKEARKRNLAVDEAALQRNFEFLRNKALMEKLLGTTAQAAITDEAVRNAYDQAVKDVTAEPELRLRTMRFNVGDINDEKAVKAAEDRAKEAIARINKGEEFAKVTEEMTGTSSPATLREAGYMTRKQMEPEIAQVAFDIEVGRISAPIKTGHGWDVIKVEGRQARKPLEFEVVRDRFAQLVGQKAQLEMMKTLRSAAKIERTVSAQQSEAPVASAPK